MRSEIRQAGASLWECIVGRLGFETHLDRIANLWGITRRFFESNASLRRRVYEMVYGARR